MTGNQILGIDAWMGFFGDTVQAFDEIAAFIFVNRYVAASDAASTNEMQGTAGI